VTFVSKCGAKIRTILNYLAVLGKELYLSIVKAFFNKNSIIQKFNKESD
jgi:predicted ATPase